MRLVKYDQKVSIHFSTTKGVKDKIEKRASDLAIESGWNPETGEGGKGPIASPVIEELIAIGFVVLELFGEDWQDHLKVQSEPLWAKKGFDKILGFLEHMGQMTPERQIEAIEQIRDEIDTSDVLESNKR